MPCRKNKDPHDCLLEHFCGKVLYHISTFALGHIGLDIWWSCFIIPLLSQCSCRFLLLQRQTMNDCLCGLWPLDNHFLTPWNCSSLSSDLVLVLVNQYFAACLSPAISIEGLGCSFPTTLVVQPLLINLLQWHQYCQDIYEVTHIIPFSALLKWLCPDWEPEGQLLYVWLSRSVTSLCLLLTSSPAHGPWGQWPSSWSKEAESSEG